MKRIFTLFLLLPFLSYCQTALTGAQIEGAINEAISKGRVITASSGSVPESALSSLPVVFRTTIDDHKYDIVVTAMNFTRDGSTMEVGARFVPNPEIPDQVLYFNSPAIGFSAKHGFKGEMAFLPEILSSSKNNQLSPEAVSLLAGRNRFFEVIMQSSGNKMVLGLDENTRLSFNCGAFEKLTLSGYLKVFNSVNQEDIAGQNINSGLPLALVFPAQTVYDWNDIFLQATVANHFHSQKIKEFGFHFETPNSALIDFSVRQNPAGLPKCSAESGNYWKGVSLGSFNLRLPEIITRKDGATLSKVPSGGLFMDVNGGLIGQAGADKLIALEHGTTAGAQPLDASLEKAYVTFACNSKIDALLSGKIKVNGCDASAKGLTSDYLFTFNESSGFSYKLNYKGGSSNMVTNEIKLESGSSLLVEVRDNGLFITQRANFTPSITTTAYNNSICRDHSTTLTIAGCPHAVEWSNGATTASITVNPTENTSYSARCYDPYCIEVMTNTIDITVYESLDTPVVTSSRTAEPYCANIEAEISTTAFCPGIVQWSENDGTWTDGEATRKVHYPSIATPQVYSYKTQCKLNECVSEISNAVTLNILPKPSGPTLTQEPGGWTVCGSAKLHATACDNGGILKWYRNGVYLGYMDGYLMKEETENGYYQYEVKCATPNGCESDVSKHNIHIDKCSCLPAPPTISSPYDGVTAEYGTYIPLHAANCSGTVVWYNSGDQMVGTGAVLSHVEMGGPHYYKATCKNQYGCESEFTGYIVLNVEKCVNAPGAPYVFSKLVDTPINQDTEYEEGTTVIIQASGCDGGTITWYNSGGGRIGTGETRDITDVGDHYFKATCTKGANDCESNLSGWVRVRIGNCVIPISAPSVQVQGNSPFNTGSQVEIVATGCGNNTVEWYNSGHQVIWTGNSYYESVKGRHFHYAKCKAPNGCVSPGSAMTDFTIGDCVHTPSAPSISAASLTVSGTQTTTLTAIGCTGGTVKWSTGETGDQINVGAGTYTAGCEVNGCLSGNSNEVTVIGDNPPTCNFTFTVASDKQSVCGTDKATLTASGCSGGTISWSTGSTETSIQVGNGTYTATCKKTGCGNKEASTTVNTSSLPSAPVITTNKNTVCNTETATLTATGCSGTVTWSSTNATGTTTSVGVGTFTATCTTDCGTSGSSNEVSVIKSNSTAPPTISTDKTILCTSEIAKLTATGCSGIVTWSNGLEGESIRVSAGTFSAICTGTNCGESVSSSPVTISSETSPYAPSITATKSAVCGSEITTLTASGCSGTVKWSSGATGVSVDVGPGSYTATCSSTNCESRISNTITITTYCPPCTISAPVIASLKTTICSDGQARIMARGCTGGTITWSNGSTGTSISVSSSATYSAYCTKDGCKSGDSNPITITVVPLPKITKAVRTEDCGSVTFTVTCENGNGNLKRKRWAFFGWEDLNTSSKTYTDNHKDNWFENDEIYAFCTSSTCDDVEQKIGIIGGMPEGTPSAPTIGTNKSSVCGSEVATLTASGCSGTVTWSSTNATGTTTNVGIGTYTATCTTDCGTSGVSNSITISTYELPAPTITSSHTIIGPHRTSVTLSSNCPSGTATKWNNGSTERSVNVSIATSYSAQCYRSNNQSCISSASNSISISYKDCKRYRITVTKETFENVSPNSAITFLYYSCDGVANHQNLGFIQSGTGNNGDSYSFDIEASSIGELPHGVTSAIIP